MVVEQALKVAHTFYHLMGLLTRRLLKCGDKLEPAFQQLADTAVNDLTNAVYGTVLNFFCLGAAPHARTL